MSEKILWIAVVLMAMIFLVSLRVAIAEAAGRGLRPVVLHPMVLGMAGLLGIAVGNAAEDLLPDIAYRLVAYPSLALAFAGALGLHHRRRQARRAQS